MSNGSPTPLSRILRGATGRLWVEAERRRQLTQLLHRQLPPILHPHCQVADLKGESLVLTTDSPVWAARLRYYSPQILQHLARHETVKPRTVRIRILPPALEPHRREPARLTLSAQNSTLLRQTAEAIDHPLLKEALRRLAARSRT